MVVAYNDIINAIARAEDVALYNARARAIELSNGCKPSKEDDDKAIEIESWIQLLTRAAANYDHETCLTDDIIWEIIQNVNEQNREVDCDVSRTYSRHSSSGGGSNPPSGYVERVLGLYVDNTDPSNPIIRIFVNPATISGDGTQTSPFSAIGGGGGAVSSVNGLTGAVVLTTTNIAEGVNLYYTNARGIASILSGLSISGGAVTAADNILQAVGKLQNQINALAGGVEYQGVWNASTNTPTLTSSVGTQGHYYVVSVAGSTNLNGITDWALGDWAIYNGTAWQKVDNTDAVISVNGQTGIVSLSTTDISEGSNQYFTTARVLNTAITGFTAGAGTVAATDTILQAINKIVGNIDTKMTNPMTTGGDIIYGGASGVPTRLANGTAGQVLQSNGSTNAPSWVAASGGSQDPIASCTAGTAVTGTTSNTYSKGLLIPAGSRTDNDAPQIDMRIAKTGTAGTVTMRYYWNTTNDLAGSPILIATIPAAIAATLSNQAPRILAIEVATGGSKSTRVVAAATGIQTDSIALSVAQSSLAIDWAIDGYLICAVQNASAADSTVCNMIKLH